MRIQTAANRLKLTSRREPYWLSLGRGRALGFRKFDGVETWRARSSDPARKYHYLTIDVAGYPPSEQFSVARQHADAWFAHLDKGGIPSQSTVGGVCKEYLEELRRSGREKAALDAETRFDRWVYDSPISGLSVSRLTRFELKRWKDRMEAYGRSLATVNRDIVPLRAALNLALERGYVTSSQAWISVLKPFAGVGKRRTTYLSKEARERLIAASDDEIRPFVWAMSVLPLRPGALANLQVEDLQITGGKYTLRVSRDKSGAGRVVPIPPELGHKLEAFVKSKLPKAPLIAQAAGEVWRKDIWGKRIRRASEKAGLAPEVVAYTLRHSVITDLITGGLDLMSAARISGTSIAMIHRHYGHLTDSQAELALAKLA